MSSKKITLKSNKFSEKHFSQLHEKENNILCVFLLDAVKHLKGPLMIVPHNH